MRRLLLLALLLPPPLDGYAATVTDKYNCFGMGWDDERCRPYRRVDDVDFAYVRLLFSREYACPVSAADMVMVMPGDNFTCRWRAPRREGMRR